VWEFSSLASAAAIVIISGIALRPRLRRRTSFHQDQRLLATQLERFVDHFRVNRIRRRPVPPDDVAEWCDRLARRMRSGSTLRESLMAIDPNGVALLQATADFRLALERGQPVPSALDLARATDPTHRQNDPHADLAFAIISIAAQLGGSNAAALGRAAGALRLRAADQHERLAQAAQARLSAHVLTVVPLAMLFLLLLIDADVRETLQTPVGALCVVVGLALNAVGWKWMRHIIGVPR
jgi:Flp pilus assembly protein TadB